MAWLANLSLVVVAGILTGEVIVDRLVPMFTIQMNKIRYEQMVIECERARIAQRSIGQRPTRDKQTDDELRKSLKIQLLSCLHQETLKNQLLNWGVRQSSIRSLELDVISRSADLRYEWDRSSRE